MTILLTGGAGHIGHVTAARLLQSVFSVRVIDSVPEHDIPLTNYESVEIRSIR